MIKILKNKGLNVIKLISGNMLNLTYENGVYYTLNLLEADYYIIKAETSITSTKKEIGDIEIYGKYIGKSRIDGFPLFSIDLSSSIRNNKINQIIS